MQNITLKGLVVSQFGSAAGLARHIGWSERKSRSVVSGKQEPTLREIETIADALEIDNAVDFVKIFFPDKSAMWTKGERLSKPSNPPDRQIKKGDQFT